MELGNNLLGDRAARAFGEALALNDHLEGGITTQSTAHHQFHVRHSLA